MGTTFVEYRDVADQPRPDHVDRLPAPGTGPVGPRRAHRATAGDCAPAIVLAAADGQPNARIAASLGVCEDTVRKWRHRWCAAPGVASLGDAKRSGRPPVFTAVQVAQVKAMACTPPADNGLPLSRWSCPELARQAVSDGICASISPSTVRRWLSEDALKPWQYQSWIFITDPDFAAQGAAGAGPVPADLGRETVGPQTTM